MTEALARRLAHDMSVKREILHARARFLQEGDPRARGRRAASDRGALRKPQTRSKARRVATWRRMALRASVALEASLFSETLGHFDLGAGGAVGPETSVAEMPAGALSSAVGRP